MKSLIPGILLIVFFGASGHAQPRLDLINEPLEDELLARILNLSTVKELKRPRPGESVFFLRLYSLDDLSDDGDNTWEYCAPGIETEVVCSFRYFLAVHDGSLGVPGTVYDLGQVGEITSIEWLKSPDRSSDRLRVQVTNYPAHAFKLNRKLVKQTKVFELTVNMDSLKIVEIR